MSKNDLLTTENGAPMADNAHFNRERIPERVVHAKGSGAYGTLRITGDISRYTKAKALQPGAQSECFVRFSKVAGERGAADAAAQL